MIYYRTKRDHCKDLFVFNEIFTVYKLDVHELLKFVLRSLTKSHEKAYLNELFVMKLQIGPPVDLLKIYLKFRR